MKPTELRIGNIVFIDNEKHWLESKNIAHVILRVGLIDCTVKNTITGEEFGLYYKFIKPIELTNEWLMRLGFLEDKELDGVYDKECFAIQIPYHLEYKGVQLRELKHVHQLQNLYYAITSNELKVNQ